MKSPNIAFFMDFGGAISDVAQIWRKDGANFGAKCGYRDGVEMLGAGR